MTIPRRALLSASIGLAAAGLLPHAIAAEMPPAPEPQPLAWPPRIADLPAVLGRPVPIAAVELLRHADAWFVRVRSRDGAEGVSVCGERIDDTWPILVKRVAPFFVGKDACQLETLVDGVYAAKSNYKYAGMPFWISVAYVEFAILDLLGRIAGKSVGELLGGVQRRSIPIYLSSLRRDTTPQQEVDWITPRIAVTGAQAVKLKIGGRMSGNADATPGRSEQLVALARRTWGDAMTIQVDANSSYDEPHAIAVGRMLIAHGVYFYEEPCPWEDFEATAAVTRALDGILVAGGEQDTSAERFRWYVRHRGLDILQPDVAYNGGLIRTLRIARLAAHHGLDITPHAPQPGMGTAYMLHFASVAPNLGRFQEFRAEEQKPIPWLSRQFTARDGRIEVPDGPGLGVTVDPDLLTQAQAVKADG